ncbi:aldolase catalytic domain-containing protein [Idiomarina abyssalis]|uniref:aldolase catalytic domain-containing protein n=1 Tax=Idiomarina abyssalis TaxID=86102 RepID=UPI001CD6FCD1|nr:aldolase catalytic domain-containing protein [Idiomarina abyssalis]
MIVLDCTLRDGGYYNNWNFPKDVVNEYLDAMSSVGVDIVELGMRSLINNGFKGASGYTTDRYLNSLDIPENLKVAVMVNASELVGDTPLEECLAKLFPANSVDSAVHLVRIACHVHEFEAALPASQWLRERGYLVGFNLMQIADRSKQEVERLARAASEYDFDVLYFADSMGSMNPEHCGRIIRWLKNYWHGALGIHTHDNLGLALPNTMRAIEEGITWVDATVTGMGRGPGNARTEELVIEVAEHREDSINLVPLMSIISSYFNPLKNKYGWGSNPYYYLSGKHGIHPTFIQEMLSDARFSEEDILAAIEHLKIEGGKKFSLNTLDATRHFYKGRGTGSWSPKELLKNRDVLILGAGPSVNEHSQALVQYIKDKNPVVVALNTQSNLPQEVIDIRVASHPVRILADCSRHTELPQALVTPVSILPEDVREYLKDKELKDFGLKVQADTFECSDKCAVIPNSLVISYALAIAVSGQSKNIYLAGFDGFGAGDKRTLEMQKVFNLFTEQTRREVTSITYTGYDISIKSVYGF